MQMPLYKTNNGLQGLYRCGCGSFRWVDIPRDTNTVQTPVCHGLNGKV